MTREKVKSRLVPLPSKGAQPLHRRILGSAATELDAVEELRLELEQALEHNQIEYEDYLSCYEALDLREQKARVALDKATGRYVKSDKVIPIDVRTSQPRPWKPWQVKLLIVLMIVIYLKITATGG